MRKLLLNLIILGLFFTCSFFTKFPSALATNQGLDFIIDDVRFSAEGLSFRLRNQGMSASNRQIERVNIYFEWVGWGYSQLFVPRRYSVYSMLIDLSVRGGFYTYLDEDHLQENEENEELFEYLTQPPDRAAFLLINADYNNEFAETNEENNLLYINRTLPDFTLAAINLTTDRLRWLLKNLGSAQTGTSQDRALKIQHQWLNKKNQTVGPAKTMRFVEGLHPGSEYPFDSDSYLNYEDDIDAQRIDELISNPPSSAVKLRIVVDPQKFHMELNEENNLFLIDRPLFIISPKIFKKLEKKIDEKLQPSL
jgi:hypothetical protein